MLPDQPQALHHVWYTRRSASQYSTEIPSAPEVKAGTMWVNCFFVRDLGAPFGSYRESGIGREGGDYSYEFFTESKVVVMKLGS